MAGVDGHRAGGSGEVEFQGYGAALVRGSAGGTRRRTGLTNVVSRDRRTIEGHRMAPVDPLPPISFLNDKAEDEVEDARWLADLIKALQSNAERRGHPEIAAALDDALNAAQAIADGEEKH